MREYIIADTSVLIVLQHIDRMDLLEKVYRRLTVTPEIASEFESPLPDWIEIEQVQDIDVLQLLMLDWDLGEASAIAIALEKTNALLILDDLKAHKIASRMELRFSGTLGVLQKAKDQGLFPRMKPILDEIAKTNFRLSDKAVRELLIKNKEL